MRNPGRQWVRKEEINSHTPYSDFRKGNSEGRGRQSFFLVFKVLLIVKIVQFIFGNPQQPVTKGSVFIHKSIILSHYFQHLSYFLSRIFIHINYPSVARIRGSYIMVTNPYRRQGHDNLHIGWFIAIIFLYLWNLSSLNYGNLQPQWSTSIPLE